MDVSKSKVLYRNLVGDIPLITHGNREFLYDSDGKEYLDFSSSACYAALGHSNSQVIDRIYRQSKDIPSVFSGFWASKEAENAGNMIAELFDNEKPGWFSKVILQQGGGEAVDLACKLAYQFHAEAGQDKPCIASRQHSYHGIGLLPFALSGYYPRYDLVSPYHDGVKSQYTAKLPHTMTATTKYILDRTEAVFRSGKVSAFIMEPVGGPPTGAWVESSAYMKTVRDLCDRYNVLLIFDEILCGTGRCGFMSVSSLYNVWPDICILGKGLTAGYQPMSAICLSKKVVERLQKGSRQVMFGTAFSAHTMGCAAVYATLSYMNKNSLFDRVKNLGPALGDKIRCALDSRHRVNGVGFLWGISLSPEFGGRNFEPSFQFHAVARKAIANEGTIVYTKGQTVSGSGDFIIIAPPFEIGDSSISRGLEAVCKGIEKASEQYERTTHVSASNS